MSVSTLLCYYNEYIFQIIIIALFGGSGYDDATFPNQS